MNNEEIIRKLSHNKLLLYLIPNCAYLIILLHYYNVNFKDILPVQFAEVIFIAILFFIITNFIYLILLKILNDRQKVFLVTIFICAFYNINLSLNFIIFLVIFTIILVIELKFIIKFKLDKIIFIIIFIVSAMFLYSATLSTINLSNRLIKSKTYDSKIAINVDDNTKTPNIYYIHCDGMMSFNSIQKYFHYDNNYLKNYLADYYINEDATLVAGHKTQRALVALFNPKYYDEFFKDYLYELEDVFLEKEKNTSYFVGYYELEEKRFTNEMFQALDQKGYTLVGIGEYNAFTSLDTDYYYDFFNNYKDQYIDLSNSQLRLIKKEQDILTKKLYTRLSHTKILFQRNILNSLVVDFTPIDYEVINWHDIDTSKYPYIDKVYQQTNYWAGKAILKSLSESMKINDHKFTFIDYNLNHDPYLFDVAGNVLSNDRRQYLGSYLGNYIYSSYILTDILNYIKNNDENAIIIVQGDHGIHTASNEDMRSYFNVSLTDVQDIRNSVMSAIYIPEEYKNGDELYLDNPLNISRYLVNNFVGENYQYLTD